MARQVYVAENALNLPPAVYDPAKRRGRLHPDYPGLWWRVTAKGVVWEHKTTEDGRDVSRQLDASTWKEAVDAWRRERPEYEDTGRLEKPIGNTTVGEVADRYLELFELKVALDKKKRKTINTYRNHVESHIRPKLGKLPVKELDERRLQDFFAHLTLQKGLSQWTQCGVKTVLHGLVDLARRERLISGNPFDLCDLDLLPSGQAKGESVLLREDELRRLILAVNPLYRDEVIVMAYSGLRVGELCGLMWRDISLLGRELKVVSQAAKEDGRWVQDRHGPKGKATAKKNNSKRTVGLLPQAQAALERQLVAEQAKGYGRPDDFVFTTTRGATGVPVQDSCLRKVLAKAAKLARVEHVSPHDFRHTTASIFAAAGVPPVTAAKWLGHTTAVYDEDYAKSFQDARERAETLAKIESYGWGVEAA